LNVQLKNAVDVNRRIINVDASIQKNIPSKV